MEDGLLDVVRDGSMIMHGMHGCTIRRGIFDWQCALILVDREVSTDSDSFAC